MFSARDVSVVVPVYNPGPHFLPALSSAASQDPGEILVIDDASSTPFPDLSHISSVRVLRHQFNRGPGAARNTGVEAATKEWIAYVDSDDLWVEGRLGTQLRLARESGADIVMGQTVYVGPDGGPDPHGRKPMYTCVMGGLLVRKTMAQRFPLDEASRVCEDLDFYVRLKEAGVPIQRHEDPVVHYRKHRNSMTAADGVAERTADITRVLFSSLARRRSTRQQGD